MFEARHCLHVFGDLRELVLPSRQSPVRRLTPTPQPPRSSAHLVTSEGHRPREPETAPSIPDSEPAGPRSLGPHDECVVEDAAEVGTQVPCVWIRMDDVRSRVIADSIPLHEWVVCTSRSGCHLPPCDTGEECASRVRRVKHPHVRRVASGDDARHRRPVVPPGKEAGKYPVARRKVGLKSDLLGPNAIRPSRRHGLYVA